MADKREETSRPIPADGERSPSGEAPAEPEDRETPRPSAARRTTLDKALGRWRRRLGLVNIAAGAVIVLLGLNVYDSLRGVIVVERFSVPEAFDKSGLNGTVLANQLIDHINRLRPSLNYEPPSNASYASVPTNVVSALFRVPAAISSSLQPPDLEIPQTGISLRALSRYLASWLGRDNFRISGELLSMDDRLRLVLRVGDQMESFEEPATHQLKAIDDLLTRSSRHVYKILQPLVWLSWECQDSARPCEDELTQNRQRWADDQLILGHFVAGLIRTIQLQHQHAEMHFQAVITTPAAPTASALHQHLTEVRAHACTARALALRAQGRVAEALKAFEDPICQQHVNAGSYWADMLLPLKRTDEAVEKAESAVRGTTKALRTAPTSPYFKHSACYANYVLGRARFEQRRYDLAVRSFAQAAEHDANYQGTFFWWAKTLHAQGKPADAERVLRRSGDLVHTDIAVRYLLAVLLAENGRPEEAIRELHETLKLNRGYADPYYELCVLYQRTGSPTHAAAHCYAYLGFAKAATEPSDDLRAKAERAVAIIRALTVGGTQG